MTLQPNENNPVVRDHLIGRNLFSFRPAALGDASIRVEYRDRNSHDSSHDLLPANTFLVTLKQGVSGEPARMQSWIVAQKEIMAKVAALDTSFRAMPTRNGSLLIAADPELDEKKTVISGDAVLALFADLEKTLATSADVRTLLAGQQNREIKHLAAQHQEETQNVISEQGWVAAVNQKNRASARIA